MACCEYRAKNDQEISQNMSIFFLICFSLVFFVGMIVISIAGLFSKRAEKVGDYCFWALVSLSGSPNLVFSKWKLLLSSSLFVSSPVFAGIVYRKLPVIALILLDFMICCLTGIFVFLLI